MTIIPTNAAPDFVAVQIECRVPGVPIFTFVYGHGTKPHGTLGLSGNTTSLEITDYIRASDTGYRSRSTDSVGLLTFPPYLTSALQISNQVNLDFTQSPQGATWGNLVLANAERQYDVRTNQWNSDGRPVSVWWGKKTWDVSREIFIDPAWADLKSVFTGLATPWTLSDTQLTVPVRDATYWLEQPAQTNTYLGTGGYNGNSAVAGKNLPRLRGGYSDAPILNVSPLLIDPTALIYQVSDAGTQIQNIYDSGLNDFTNDGDVADLYTGSVAAGHVRTCNAKGMFQLGSKPVGQVTCDAVGLFPDGNPYVHPAQIAYIMLIEDFGLPSTIVDFASMNAIYLQNTDWRSGNYWDSSDTSTCVDAIDAVLQGTGIAIVPFSDGTLHFVLMEAIPDGTMPAASFDETTIVTLAPASLPSNLDPPPYLIRIGYGHNYTVMNSGLVSGVTADRVQWYATADRFAVWEDATIASTYKRPNAPAAMPSPLINQSNAQDVANRLGALWGVRRRLYSVEVPVIYGIGRQIGDVINLDFPLEDLDGGQLGRIVGVQFSPSDATMTFLVLV